MITQVAKGATNKTRLKNWTHEHWVEGTIPKWAVRKLPKRTDPIKAFMDAWMLHQLFTRPELSGAATTEEELRAVDFDSVRNKIKNPAFSWDLVTQYSRKYGSHQAIQRTPKELHPWVKAYRLHLTDIGSSQSRVKDDPIRAQIFVDWLRIMHPFKSETSDHLNLRNLSPEHARSYNNYLLRLMKDGEYARNTVVGYIDVTINFLKFCEARYRIRSLAHGLKVLQAIPDPDYWIPSHDQLADFFTVIANYSPNVLRDATLFSLMASNGLRPSEVLNLQWSGVDTQFGTITFVEKGRNVTTMELSTVSRELLEKYRKSVARQKRVFLPDDWAEHRALKYLRMLVTVYSLIADWPVDAVQPYTFRHAFCTHLLVQTGDYLLVNELARHGDLNKTRRYIHLSKQFLSRKLIQVQDVLRISLPDEIKGDEELCTVQLKQLRK